MLGGNRKVRILEVDLKIQMLESNVNQSLIWKLHTLNEAEVEKVRTERAEKSGVWEN